MANFTKDQEMFDRLKNLFRRRAEDDSATEPAPSTFPPREFQPGYSPANPASAPPQPAPAPHAAPFRPSDADALETAHPATVIPKNEIFDQRRLYVHKILKF